MQSTAPYTQTSLQASDTTVPTEASPLTLDKLADQVSQVASHYKVKECLGLGVGNGGYVLTLCAAQHIHLFSGLVLISPSCLQAGWWEWATGRLTMAQLSFQGWSRWACDSITRRLFSNTTLQILGGDSDLLKAFHREAPSVSAISTIAYLSAALTRHSLVSHIPKLRCRVLLIYGEEGIYLKDCLALASHVDKSRFALVEVPSAGVLVNEERPTELLSPLQLFLTALQLEGYGLGSSLQVGQ